MAPTAKTKPDVVTPEMEESAKASAAKATKDRAAEEQASGVGVLRRRGQGPGRNELFDSDVPYPVEAHGKDFEFYGPQGQAASIPEGTDIETYSIDQEFVIDPEKVKTFKFKAPGQNLPKKRLYTVKALHKDGRLVQLGFEDQIQNNAGGDPEDAIGLRRYQRKGITVLINWSTLVPLYCAAWGCWAQASTVDEDGEYVPLDPSFPGFCSQRHAMHTLPNKYKNSGEILSGMFGEGATTSRTWSV